MLGWENYEIIIGLEGISHEELIADFSLEFDIGELNIAVGYTTGNLLLSDKIKYNYLTAGVTYHIKN